MTDPKPVPPAVFTPPPWDPPTEHDGDDRDNLPYNIFDHDQGGA